MGDHGEPDGAAARGGGAVSVLAATVTPQWLSLRAPADHEARSRELVRRLTSLLPTGDAVVHDLGSGTGSMTRWLAPQLPRAQHWVLHDLDDALLASAIALTALRPFQDAAITISTRRGDVTTLTAADLAGATLVTTSALLDLLTADEVTRLATACVNSGCPALFTLSVTGRVQLTPAHSLDAAIEEAFNDHQRRVVGGRRLLGPDAVAHAARTFTRLGAEVHIAHTPWQLGAGDVGLIVEWLTGWVTAACAQQPELTGAARGYLRQRLADAAAAQLHVTVGHADLLAIADRGYVEPHRQKARVTTRRKLGGVHG
jgi:trans-aconitate methyltransferase